MTACLPAVPCLQAHTVNASHMPMRPTQCQCVPACHSANDLALLLFWPATAALEAACRAAAVPRVDKLAALRELDNVETALGLLILLRLAAHVVDIYTTSDVAVAVQGSAAAAQRAMARSLRKLRGGMVLHQAQGSPTCSRQHVG